MLTRPRWQKVAADITGNRARSILVTASVAVGLFAIGVILTVYLVIAADMRASYQQMNPANVYLKTALFDDEHLPALARLPGVSAVQATRTVDLRVRNRSGQWQSIRLIVTGADDRQGINRPVLAAGRWPSAEDEIAIEQTKLGDLNAQIGGQVIIEQQDGERTRALTITGVVQDLTLGAYLGGGGFFAAPMEGFISQSGLEAFDLPRPELYSGVYLTTAAGEDEAAIQAAAALAADALENAGVDVESSATRRSSDHPNAFVVNAIVGVLLVLGLLVVFLSGFLITNTFQALLSQQAQQIGIMKTVGARRAQIAGVYIAMIVGYGLLAFAIAAPSAYWLSFLLLRLMAGAINFVLQGTRIIWPVLALQAGLALLMPLAAAALPIWQGTRISVQEALSGAAAGGKTQRPAPTHTRARRLAHRINDLLARWFSRPMLISLRNTFRRKGRLLLTLLTLTLGGAVFISTFTVQVSLSRYIDQIGQYFLSDVTVTLDRPYRYEEMQQLLADVPGVGRVEGWGAAQAELVLENGAAGDSVQLLAPPGGSPLVQPVLISGRWVQAGDSDGIALSEMFRVRYPNLRAGDRLTLQVLGQETEWTVVGFYRFAGKNGGFGAYTTDTALARVTGLHNKAATFQVVAAQPGLSAAGQDELAQRVEARLRQAGVRVVDRTTGAYLTDLAGGAFAVLVAFLLFLAGLTALVGSIGLTGTMSMNVLERTREIGVMRAIGASNGALMQMVVVEGMLIGLLSYGLGALLSFPISKAMADGIALAVFEAPSEASVSPVGFLIWLVLVLALSFLASVAPARSAARLTIREVLAYE